MKIIHENMTLYNFDAWSGGKDTKEAILNANKGDEFDAFIEEIFPNGLTDVQLNDLLWFESDWIFENLGIDESEEE